MYTFSFSYCGQLSLIARVELLGCAGLEVPAELPAAPGGGCVAARAEEGVVADTPLLQERVVEGIHAGEPLALGGR